MRPIFRLPALLLLCAVVLAGCEVPTPPPELPTATPGSQNPESLQARPASGALGSASPSPAAAPLPATPGRIYFVRDSGLWSIEPDGSAEKRLSSLPVSNTPQPSPDGSMVAFTADKALYVIPAEGGEARKLASGEMVTPQRTGWSNDGKLLGYMTFDLATPGDEQAWAVPVSGGSPVQVTTLVVGASGRGPSYESSVQWSPDGRWILASGPNNPSFLLRWPAPIGDPSDKRAIAGGEPDWAPDSRTIIYSQTVNGALAVYYVVETGATPFRNEQRYVGTRLGDYAQGPRPRWSPSSSYSRTDMIAYRSRSTAGEPQVALRQRDGEELEPLPALTNNPAWSPGGDRLAVETGLLVQDTFGLRWQPNGLVVAHVQRGTKPVLTPLTKDARWPAWGR